MTLREIIMRANTTCRRLGREEDGVVLSVVMVTLMSLYLMGAATFAVGEHIRDRIEIQNAVDAAAYSAAIVQADTLSRIAAINQAMAWTYIQMVKRHMDYIRGIWLNKVVVDYKLAKVALEAHANLHRFRKPWNIYDPISDITINGKASYTLAQIEQDLNQSGWSGLPKAIDDDRQLLTKMGDAQKALINQMPDRMRQAAMDVLQRNLSLLPESRFVVAFGESGLGEDAMDGFVSYGTGEDVFLKALSGQDVSNNAAFGAGANPNEWFPHQDSNIWREYKQVEGNTKMLHAEWTGSNQGYVFIYKGKYYIYGSKNVARVIKGIQLKDDYFATRPIKPHRLKQEFFDQTGAIVVAVARPLRHPFDLFVRNGEPNGFYDAFNEDDDRMMLAVAAARAGYRDVGRSFNDTGELGTYNPHKDSYEIVKPNVPDPKAFWRSTGWNNLARNLGQTDWDATLIPLRRAWTGRNEVAWQNRSGVIGMGDDEAGTWGGDSSEAVLGYLLNQAQWQDLATEQPLQAADWGPIRRRLRPATPNEPDPPLVLTGFGSTPAELGLSLFH